MHAPDETITRQNPGPRMPPPAATARPSSPRAILIIRLSGLREVTLATAVIHPLRRRYPHARLVWLVRSDAEPLIAGNEALDAVLTVPREWGRLLRRGRWWRLAREVTALIRRLRAEHFDLALDLQGLWKSSIWARLAAAPRRTAVGPCEGNAMLLTAMVERTRSVVTPGGEYDTLLWTLGAERTRPRLGIAPTHEVGEAATKRLAEAYMSRGFIALCPFARRPQEQWFAERWAALATRLRQETGWPIILFGGPDDRAAAAEILGASGGKGIVDWTGTTGIGEAAALLGSATLVIGVDTALTHIAVGQGRPTVALFGAKRPWRAPQSLPVRVVSQDSPCARCARQPTCGGAKTCIQEIGVGDVLIAAHALLDRRDQGIREAMERHWA